VVHHEHCGECTDTVDQASIGQQPDDDQQPSSAAIVRVSEQLDS
jgi:hypothetical protein